MVFKEEVSDRVEKRNHSAPPLHNWGGFDRSVIVPNVA